MRILVVEDETAIADFVQRGLEAEGYSVACAGDGPDGERQALGDDVDLVVLDLMLPGRDGLSVLDSIRHSKPTLPVIVLTARDAVEDKVAGLDGGATDYVTKPFSFDELTARIRAHLRATGQQREPTTLDAAGIHVNLLTREVTLGDEAVHLSTREFDLLAHFIRHCGEVLSREQILAAVWGYDFDPGTNVVEVYVGYLRRKLAASGGPARIETLRSVGYRLTDR
jgi:two-component system, OmpR family, copper resistance phosphate regulon response regulator CusR